MPETLRADEFKPTLRYVRTDYHWTWECPCGAPNIYETHAYPSRRLALRAAIEHREVVHGR